MIEIGDTLLNALKEFKQEQEIFKEQYGELYMKHYANALSNLIVAGRELKKCIPKRTCKKNRIE